VESSDRNFEAIFDRAPVGIAQIDLQGKFLRANDRYCEMLGYSEAELLAKSAHEINHPEDCAEVLSGRRQLLDGAISSHSMEKRYVRKDGSVFWARLNRSLVRNSENQAQYFIAVVEDLTEKKLAERARVESDWRLEMALDSAGLGLWDRDLRTGKTNISGEYAKLHGLSPDHPPLTYEEWLKLVHPDDRNRVNEQYRESLSRARDWDTDFRLVWPDGSVHWMLAKGQVFRDSVGCPIRLAGITIDITERKRIEEHCSLLSSIVESCDDAIFSKNLDGTIVSWNSGAERLFGYTAEEIIGKSASVLLPPECVGEYPAILETIRSGAHLEHHEVTRMRKDGRRVEVTVTISPVKNSEAMVVGSSTIARDITDRKRGEIALMQSEERFRLAIKATNDAIWDLDLETGFVTWNETYSTLYGRPPETSHSYQWWIDQIHPDDRTRTVESLQTAISSDAESWTSEYRFRRTDGRWANIYDRAYISRNPSGKARRVIGAMQDLTERKQAEAFQREIELQYKDVFDNISVCMFLIDVVPGGRFKYVAFNAAEEKAVALSNSEISGKFVEEVFPKDLANKLIANYSRCLSAAHAIQFDDALDLPHGRRYFHTNLIPLRNGDAGTRRIVGACIDITDLKRTQEESLAKQNLESLGVLAGGIAHDFNNILGAISAQAELIETELAVGSAQRGEIQEIQFAAMRGSEIVRELMVYAGRDETSLRESINLSRLIQETLGLIRVSISKHAVMRTALEPDLPPVSGNSAQIRQVLMNLIINASEAIGSIDGTITLRTELVARGSSKGPSDATGLASEDYVLLEVSDTGDGIPDEVKAKIFDPFFTTKFAGRGMGLAVVNKVVHDHGGIIRLTTPGRGTTFQVFLPCALTRPPEALISPHSQMGLQRVQNRSILIAEDEELLRIAVSRSLRKSGFSVLEARDGSEAMALMCENIEELGAVLLDVTLPGTSSREILEEARRLRPDLRIVVTSAYGKGAVDQTFLGLPIPYFIRKPFSVHDLIPLLNGAH